MYHMFGTDIGRLGVNADGPALRDRHIHTAEKVNRPIIFKPFYIF